MQTKEKNKMLDTDQEFFFPGGTEYEPKTVTAKSIEEAQKIWDQEKQKVELPKNNQETNIWEKESDDSSKSE